MRRVGFEIRGKNACENILAAVLVSDGCTEEGLN